MFRLVEKHHVFLSEDLLSMDYASSPLDLKEPGRPAFARLKKSKRRRRLLLLVGRDWIR